MPPVLAFGRAVQLPDGGVPGEVAQADARAGRLLIRIVARPVDRSRKRSAPPAVAGVGRPAGRGEPAGDGPVCSDRAVCVRYFRGGAGHDWARPRLSGCHGVIAMAMAAFTLIALSAVLVPVRIGITTPMLPLAT